MRAKQVSCFNKKQNIYLVPVKGIYLSEALTCKKFLCTNKNCFFIKETDTVGHIVV